MPVRTFRVFLSNNTDFPLIRANHHLCHGEWTSSDWEPPPVIDPKTERGWQSESDGIATGTEGWVKYRRGVPPEVIPGGTPPPPTLAETIYIYWDNPFLAFGEGTSGKCSVTLKEIAPLYFEAGTIALAIAALVFPPSAAAAGVAAAISGVLSQESTKIIDKIIGPFLKSIIDFVSGLLGGTPFCDGEVLRHTLVLPGDDFERLASGEQFSFTITGPQENDRCGQAPTTTLTYSLIPASLRKFLKPRFPAVNKDFSLKTLQPSIKSVRSLMSQ